MPITDDPQLYDDMDDDDYTDSSTPPPSTDYIDESAEVEADIDEAAADYRYEADESDVD